MQNHNDTMKTSDTVLRKIYLSLYLKGLYVRGSRRPNRTAAYWPPLYWSLLHFFPVLLGCSTGGLGAQPHWVLFFSTASYLQFIWSPTATAQSGAWGLPLLGAGFLYRILSPTDWISCALSYIIVQRPPSSCGRHKLHSFNPSTVKAIPRLDVPVIYIGAFPILTARPGRRSIYNTRILARKWTQ